MGIASDLVIIIIAGLIFGFIAHKLNIPMVLGYIIAGIVIGPYTPGIQISDAHQIEMLAEIGVALLLFSLGLEFSFEELKQVKHIAIIGTLLEVICSIAAGFWLGRLIGLSNIASIWLGSLISLSSTMVVLKTLMNQKLMGTLSSKVMIGILIVQDLVAVVMMIFLPQLKDLKAGLPVLGFSVLKAIVFLILTIVIGRKLMPKLLQIVAKWNSRELFLLTITAIALGIGYATYLAGLSFAFGAFIAGMVLSESEYAHQALNDIMPLRDIFVLLFFTSVGMLFDPSFVAQNIKIILFMVLAILITKGVIFAIISRLFGYRNIIPYAVGFGLSQIGEFSFVLSRLALEQNVFDRKVYSIVLMTSVITMIMTPFLTRIPAPIYNFKKKLAKTPPVQTINAPKKGLYDHVIIAGCGRIGEYLADTFQQLKVKFVVIEQDYKRFENAQKKGYPVIYGDSGQAVVLDAAKIANARLLLITTPDMITTKNIINYAQLKKPDLNVVARANDLEQIKELYSTNIYEVVQPEFEASLEILRQGLLHLDFPAPEIQKYTDNIRKKLYSPLETAKIDNKELRNLKRANNLLEMNWKRLAANSKFIGKNIKELKIREETGASIVGIIRNNDFIQNPDPTFSFEKNDCVAFICKTSEKEKIENLLLGEQSF